MEEELNALVRKLPCYQGEGSMANQPSKSVGVEGDEKSLEENQRNQLKEELKKVEEVKIKLQEDRVKLEEYTVKVKAKVERENAKVEKGKAEVKREKAEVEEEKTKVELEKTRMEEEKAKLGEERVRVEKLIKEQESLVECPVCLSLPREDRAVPCCPKGHFVCTSCLENLIRQAQVIVFVIFPVF